MVLMKNYMGKNEYLIDYAKNDNLAELENIIDKLKHEQAITGTATDNIVILTTVNETGVTVTYTIINCDLSNDEIKTMNSAQGEALKTHFSILLQGKAEDLAINVYKLSAISASH